MLWSGRITVMIMINAIILTHSSADGGVNREIRSTLSGPHLSKKFNPEDNYIRHSKSRNNRRRKHGLNCKRKWDLEPVIIKLKNVIDRYDSKWKEVKLLYAPVELCVPDKCGKTRHLIPKYLLPKEFKCAKIRNCSCVKKKILRTLKRFHSGIRYFAEKFQNLTITHQKQGRKINGSRLRLLNEFKNDLEMLNIETESVMTKKRLNNIRRRKSLSVTVSSNSNISKIYQTDLLINERLTIQHSKEFLTDWMGKLKNVLVGNES